MGNRVVALMDLAFIRRVVKWGELIPSDEYTPDPEPPSTTILLLNLYDIGVLGKIRPECDPSNTSAPIFWV